MNKIKPLQQKHSLSKTNTGMIQLILAFMLGGSSIIPAKILSTQISATGTTLITLCLAWIILLPVQLKTGRSLKSFSPGAWLNMILQSLTGLVLFRLLTIKGLQRISGFQAGIIFSTSPAVLALLSILILKEKPNLKILTALGLAVAGLFLLNGISPPSASAASTSPGGILLISAAVTGEALMSILRKAVKDPAPSHTNTFILVSVGLVVLLPFVIVHPESLDLKNLDSTGIIALFYYGWFATAGAYLFWGSGAPKVPGMSVGIFHTALPVTAMILSIVLLQESVKPSGLIGGALALLGMVVMITPQKWSGKWGRKPLK